MLKTVPLECSFANNPKSQFWNYELNGDLKPEDVTKSTQKKFWFKCDNKQCNHNFEMALNNVSNGKWCPYCCIPSRILCNLDNCQLCYNKSFASHEKSKFWSSKNGEITPRMVFKSCDTIKYYLKCNVCNHDFSIALSSLKQGNWCSFCGNRELCDNNDCTMCFNNSFASIEKSRFWSSKNRDIKPRNVFKCISNKYLFDCDICNHTFEMGLNTITKGGWCNYCANRVLCDKNDCKICYDKSFASHKKSNNWDNAKNGTIKPRMVFLNSYNKYWINCDICNHLLQTRLIDYNEWCAYCCVPPKKLCNDNNCLKCFNNSFASHQKSSFWSDKNKNIPPRQIFKGTHVKYLFDCNICNHTFTIAINSITSKCSWCN